MHLQRKKKQILALSSIVLFLLFAGCIGQEAETITETKETTKATTIVTTKTEAPEAVVVRFMGWGAGATEVENYEKMIADFREDNPHIIVKYEVVSQQLHENVLASFGAGVAPDIFYMDSQWAPVFMDKGALYPMDDLTTPAVMGQYYDYLLAPFRGADGKVYGLPKDWSMLQLYYNKDLLSQAGWSTPPDTWDDFVACAKAVTDATGKPGICLYDGNFNRHVPVATSNGAPEPWFASAADAGWFDNTAVKDSLKFYIEMFTEGKKAKVDAGQDPWLALPADVGAGWLGDAFGSEEVGMVISGNWAIPFLDGTFPDFEYDTDWGIAPIPKGSAGRATMAYTVALGINADSEHPAESWKFVEFLLGKEGQTELVVKMGQTLPSISGLEEHPDLWPQHAATLSHEYDTVTVFVWGPQGSALEGDFSTIMADAMRGELSVNDAIAAMKIAVEDAFA